MNAEELRSVQTPLKEHYREAGGLARPPVLAFSRKRLINWAHPAMRRNGICAVKVQPDWPALKCGS